MALTFLSLWALALWRAASALRVEEKIGDEKIS